MKDRQWRVSISWRWRRRRRARHPAPPAPPKILSVPPPYFFSFTTTRRARMRPIWFVPILVDHPHYCETTVKARAALLKKGEEGSGPLSPFLFCSFFGVLCFCFLSCATAINLPSSSNSSSLPHTSSFNSIIPFEAHSPRFFWPPPSSFSFCQSIKGCRVSGNVGREKVAAGALLATAPFKTLYLSKKKKRISSVLTENSIAAFDRRFPLLALTSRVSCLRGREGGPGRSRASLSCACTRGGEVQRESLAVIKHSRLSNSRGEVFTPIADP